MGQPPERIGGQMKKGFGLAQVKVEGLFFPCDPFNTNDINKANGLNEVNKSLDVLWIATKGRDARIYKTLRRLIKRFSVPKGL
jgi:hypothetical protein